MPSISSFKASKAGGILQSYPEEGKKVDATSAGKTLQQYKMELMMIKPTKK